MGSQTDFHKSYCWFHYSGFFKGDYSWVYVWLLIWERCRKIITNFPFTRVSVIVIAEILFVKFFSSMFFWQYLCKFQTAFLFSFVKYLVWAHTSKAVRDGWYLVISLRKCEYFSVFRLCRISISTFLLFLSIMTASGLRFVTKISGGWFPLLLFEPPQHQHPLIWTCSLNLLPSLILHLYTV